MRTFTCSVPASFAGEERLDKYVSSQDAAPTRSQIKEGALRVLVNGTERKLSHKVRSGDEIALEWEAKAVSPLIAPEDIPLDVLYEDDDVCVVNKAQGMVVHPAAGHWSGTLVNALLFRWGKEAIDVSQAGEGWQESECCRPFIVHRLDKDTSGVMITAKNARAKDFLAHQFQSRHGLTKEYIAICRGRPPQVRGVVQKPIARDPKDGKLFCVSPTGKTAQTFYRCICCYGEYSLMVLRITTGRTHQIRVHLKSIGCPVLGDPLYSKSDRKFPRATLMLHSRLLSITLPSQSTPSLFKAHTPERFLSVLQLLKHSFKKTIPCCQPLGTADGTGQSGEFDCE